MATAFRSGTLGLIQHLFDGGTFTGLSDARLLERFVTRRDEAAFAALVVRHGAMVLNTCRAVLKDPNAADDAFQATFVLLFRKAGSIHGRDALGGWLHRVAYRVALQAESDASRRRDVEKAAGALRGAESPPLDDLGAILHEEIERLPERFRIPVVLCDLEGMTRDQAAQRLRWTEGSLRGRLAKGRELLRRRLTRRGITLAVPLAFPTTIPEGLVSATVRAAAVGASETIAALVTAASGAWVLSRSKVAAATLLLALGTTAGSFVYRNIAASQPPGDDTPARPVTAAVAQLHPPAVPASPAQGRTTVEGRILDLEGRPVAGATVGVKFVQAPPDGKLDAWIDEVRRLGKQPYGLPIIASPGRRPPFSATTGRDGRFRIDAMPGDAIATASITGPGIETSEVYILTRDIPTIRVKDPVSADGPTVVYYGSRFDHVSTPVRTIAGTVRDTDTGKPIPGVHITGMPNLPHSLIPTPGVEATSDAQGRFQISGLPISRGFRLFTEAPPGQPYVNCGFTSPGGEFKPGPLTFDMALKRGVLIRGRLTDLATGRPVRGSVIYSAFPDNSFLGEFPNFKRGSQITRVVIPGPDGRFTIPALPGRGLIAARAQEERYLHGIGAGVIKGFDKGLGAFKTYPFICSTADQHVFAEINPAPEMDEVALELRVDPGRTVSGTIVGPDGQAISGGVEIRTLDVFQSPRQSPGDSPEFEVTGLPSGPYRLDFIHRGRKLAGAIVLKGDETERLTAKLQPWGTAAGRVVDEEGRPRTDVELFSTIRHRADPERGDLENKPTVDAEGRFRIEGLVAGVKYDAWGHSPNKATGPILEGVLVGPGEVKDLGDVTLPTRKDDGN